METLQRTANRGSVSTGYDIDNSLKLEDDNTEGMAKNFSGDGNQKTWTYSTWVKRTEISGSDAFHLFGASYTNIQFMTNDLLRVELYDGASTVYADLNRVFRDTSAWYHIVVTLDTTQSTAADRVKIYINGVQDTSFNNSTYTTKAQDTNFQIGSATADYQFGYYFVGGGNDRRFCGYVAETHYVNGTALDCTSFGEFDDNGIWIPKEYTGSHGTKGFYFKFDDSSNLGKDSSSGGVGDFTLTNITAADQATDTPTNNFCTLNPLVNFKYGTNAGGMTNGATVFGDDTGGGVGGAFGTMAVTAGKWYWEMKLTQQVSHYPGISAVDDGDNVLASSDPHEENSTFRFNISAARREYVNSGSQTYGSLDEFSDFHSTGDIISIALNMDDNQISIYGNGTLQSGIANSSIFDAANKTVVPFHGTINDEVQYNFGGYSAWTPSSAASDANGYGTFEYAPPSGYYALCTKNLAQYGG